VGRKIEWEEMPLERLARNTGPIGSVSRPPGSHGYTYQIAKNDSWHLFWWPLDMWHIRAQLVHAGRPYAFYDTTLTVGPGHRGHPDKEAAFKWARELILSPLEQLSEAYENPTQRKTFTPSYGADSQRTYDVKVAQCAPYVGTPWRQRGVARASGYPPEPCKRLEHDMIVGGRSANRYPKDAPYPRDKKKGGPEKQGKKEGRRTKKRLSGPHRIYSARTQPVKIRTTAAIQKSGYADPSVSASSARIRAAIDKYRQHFDFDWGSRGLSVPDVVGPLLKAGMPSKAAHILVGRAARMWYPDVPPAEMTQLTLLAQIQHRVGPLEGYYDVDAAKRQIRVEGKERELGYLVEVSASAGDNWKGLLDDRTINTSLQAWVEKKKAERADEWGPGKYEASGDDPVFVRRLFNDDITRQLLALAREWKVPNLTVELFFSGLERGFDIPFSVREHSKLSASKALPSEVDYRSLQNVSLTDLPELLARLSRRKKRKGRKLKPLSPARNNPRMAQRNDPMLQFVASEVEAGRLVDVPGKPDRVYWPSSKRKVVSQGMIDRGGASPADLGKKVRIYTGLKETTRDRALSWMAIADAGKAARGELRDVALETYGQEGMSRRPLLSGPTTSSAAIPARENPMSKKSYWERQYQTGPYGANRSVPAARRNKSRKSQKKRKLSPEAEAKFRLVGQIAQKYAKEQGCDMSTAMKQAWADVKGMRAAANPWYPGTPSLYLPDNPVMNALVPAPYAWSDETEVFSALVPGPYTKGNPKWHAPRYEERARQTRAMSQPRRKKAQAAVRRGKGHKKAHWKKQGHPAYSKFSSRPRMPNYEQVLGQFSTQQDWVTQGMQPMNRRNPGGMTGRFPGECCMCGGETRGTEIVQHPTMRGPRGGKKYAHTGCL